MVSAVQYESVFTQWAPDHHNGLSNHLPMAILALIRLGANEQKIEEFSKSYCRQLDPLQEIPTQILTEQALLSLAGKGEKFHQVQVSFDHFIQTNGLEDTLKTWLPRLCTGSSTRAFHPLIRLGYAIQFQLEREIAHALADWLVHLVNYPWPTNHHTSHPGSLENLISNLQNKRQSFQPIVHRLIDDELGAVTLFPEYQSLILQPGINALSLADMQKVALNWYLQSHDFCALHGITGSYAFNLIIPYLEDLYPALKSFWLSLVLAYLSRSPVDTKEKTPISTDLSTLKSKAIASMDAHTIKLTDVCLQQYEITSNIDYLQAAWTRI
ncbi:questin oxidase family protein [Gynuella sp.]|uniref:questin oxidase family protein n=1 Tax=Gynuella sp. TaxID=2969146 RepID=UPI003D128D79